MKALRFFEVSNNRRNAAVPFDFHTTNKALRVKIYQPTTGNIHEKRRLQLHGG